jgi:ribosomal protein L17
VLGRNIGGCLDCVMLIVRMNALYMHTMYCSNPSKPNNYLQPRAKAIRKYVDKMISLAKEGTLHARRQALAFIYDEDLVRSLFEQVPSRYGDRNGGYCRVKAEIQKRRGDNAELATIELV